MPFGKRLEIRAARPTRNVPYLPLSISAFSLRYTALPRRLRPTHTTCFDAFCAFTIARPSATVAVRGFSQ